jgi:hypothetical protein
MRGTSVAGLLLVAIGFIILFLLRGLLVQVLLLLLDVFGLVIGFALIAIGLALIFGGRAVKRWVVWRAFVPVVDAHDIVRASRLLRFIKENPSRSLRFS